MVDAIDVHTHIVPEQFPPYLGRHTNVPWPSMTPAAGCSRHVVIRGRVYRTVPDSCWNVTRRIEDMEHTRVARQALSPMPELLSYWLPIDDAIAMARHLNEHIALMIDRAPTRFVGLGSVPLGNVDQAIRELEAVIQLPGFAGVEIASHVNGVSIGDPRFEPFFAAAESLNAAVFVHPLRPAGSERVVGPFPEQAVCFPGDIALAAASMITGGTAARHPTLRLGFSHGGGALALLLPRLQRAWTVDPAIRDALSEPPVTTARRFYFDELVFDPTAVEFLLASFGATQLVLGSDYPFALGEPEVVASIERIGLEPEVMAAVRSVNARRFLGIA